MELSDQMENMEKDILQMNQKEIQAYKDKFEREHPPNPIPKFSKDLWALLVR